MSVSAANVLPQPPVTLHADFMESAAADLWLRWCRRKLPWRQDRVRMFGREVACRRLVAFVAEDGCHYCYAGSEHCGTGIPPRLRALIRRVNATLDTAFDSILFTRYRDGDDRMGWHRDRERELGPDPELAVLSLGAIRTLAFRYRPDRGRALHNGPVVAEGGRPRFLLGSGSLLHMRAGTQPWWQHQVPPRRRAGERVSLSFRRLRAS